LGLLPLVDAWTTMRRPHTAATPAPPLTATAVRYQAMGVFATACPPALPVKLTLSGTVVSPGVADYAAARPLVCYDTVAHAQEDSVTAARAPAPTATAQPTAPPATPAPGVVAASEVYARVRDSAPSARELPAGF